MRVVSAKKLAERGIASRTDPELSLGAKLVSATMEDNRFLDAFPSPPATPPAPIADDAILPRSPQVGSAAINDGGSSAAALRLAARQEAGVSSQLAFGAAAEERARAAAVRPSRKRGSTAGALAGKKRARQALAREADRMDELMIPSLEPSTEVMSCTVLDEEAMMTDMSYLTLETNWQPPESLALSDEQAVKTASAEEWEVIVTKQRVVDFVLKEESVRLARKALLEKAAEIRAVNDIDGDSECPVYVDTITAAASSHVKLTMQTLQAMGSLHVGAGRLQDFHVAVAWLKQAAAYSKSRVPMFLGGERASVGEMGTALM